MSYLSPLFCRQTDSSTSIWGGNSSLWTALFWSLMTSWMRMASWLLRNTCWNSVQSELACISPKLGRQSCMDLSLIAPVLSPASASPPSWESPVKVGNRVRALSRNLSEKFLTFLFFSVSASKFRSYRLENRWPKYWAWTSLRKNLSSFLRISVRCEMGSVMESLSRSKQAARYLSSD